MNNENNINNEVNNVVEPVVNSTDNIGNVETPVQPIEEVKPVEIPVVPSEPVKTVEPTNTVVPETPAAPVEPAINPTSISEVPVVNEKVSSPITNSEPISTTSNNKKGFPKILIIAIILVVVSALAFFGYKLITGSGNGNSSEDKSRSSSFFLAKDQSDKYALFNGKGKRLTDFLYSYPGEFYDGSIVVTLNEKTGIMNDQGKMVVDFGKYEYITRYDGVYEARNKDYTYTILNSKGKVLYESLKNDIDYYGDEYKFIVINNNKDNTYDILDSHGKKFLSIPIKKGVASLEKDDKNDRYYSLFYNNKNYVIDAKEGKKVAEFESEKHYCINTDDTDGKYITLNSCVSWYESQDKVYYKVIVDGKLQDLSDKCSSISSDDGILYCSKDGKIYIMNSNLEIGLEIDYSYKNTTYIDSDHYIEEYSSSPDKVLFYNKGKVVNEVSCRKIEKDDYVKGNVYTLKTTGESGCDEKYGLYEFYDKKGNKLGKIYEDISSGYDLFDDNNLTIVSEDSKRYYLVNDKIEKVSEEFDEIELAEKTKYYFSNENGYVGVLDKKGKTIVDAKYDEITIYEVYGTVVAVLNTKDSSFIVYDLKNNKEIISLKSNPDIFDYFMRVSDNGKTYFYNYSGKMFYSE